MIKSQLRIGPIRAFYMEAPEAGLPDRRWWFEFRDTSVSPPKVLAIRHVEVPEEGDREFEQWLKTNVSVNEHFEIPRIWGSIKYLREGIDFIASSGV